MGKTITATEVVRRFSEILNAIKYKGEEYTILRSGKPVAFISPVKTFHRERYLGELKELLKGLPRLDEEAEKFERDLKKIRENQPSLPDIKSWG